MTSEEEKSLHQKYLDVAKESLIKVQYSCGGNATGIDETDTYVPIVPDHLHSEVHVSYLPAREDDVSAILHLLRTCQLPVSDLASGQRMFFVALADEQVIGCVAVEIYADGGLLRSLAVDSGFRGRGIGQKLVSEAENWAVNNGLSRLYLLTTTAAGFFTLQGWKNTERATVPATIALSSEFASVCPSTAVCMTKTLL